MSRRANMGMGTLILLIAMLIVAAIIGTIVFVTEDSIIASSDRTQQRTESEISTHVFVEDISATNGENHSLEFFTQIIKLTSGSERFPLDDSLVRIITENSTAVLRYRENGQITHNNSGYNTWMAQELGEVRTQSQLVNEEIDDQAETPIDLDLDRDGTNETVIICSATMVGTLCPSQYYDNYLRFNLSTDGYVYSLMQNDSGDVINLSVDNNDPISISNGQIGSYGTFTMYGNQTFADRLGSAFDNVTTTVSSAYVTLDEDLDDDGNNDGVALNRSHVLVSLSSLSSPVAISLGALLNSTPATIDVDETVMYGDTIYATVEISATVTQNDIIPASETFTITPYDLGGGYYVAEYLHEGDEYREGVMGRGDVVKLHYATPDPVREDEAIKVFFIPKHGSPTVTEFITPNVINQELIPLFP